MGRSIDEIAAEVGLPVENFHPTGGGLHMEIIDTTNAQVWQVMDVVTQGDFDALEVEAPYHKVGIGGLAGDCSFFRRSPGAAGDGPMETMEYGRHRWSQCAKPMGPPEFPFGPDGARLMKVDKHHSVVYAAEREVAYIRSPEGEYYVRVIDGGRDEDLGLPSDWERVVVRTEKELILHLPCPTDAFFFKNFESYQGPVPEPDLGRS